MRCFVLSLLTGLSLSSTGAEGLRLRFAALFARCLRQSVPEPMGISVDFSCPFFRQAGKFVEKVLLGVSLPIQLL
jgi:hypothetical protein